MKAYSLATVIALIVAIVIAVVALYLVTSSTPQLRGAASKADCDNVILPNACQKAQESGWDDTEIGNIFNNKVIGCLKSYYKDNSDASSCSQDPSTYVDNCRNFCVNNFLQAP